MNDNSLLRYTMNDRDFRKLSEFIDRELGIKMPEAKKIMLESRLHKRLKALGFTDYGTYVDFLLSEAGYKEESGHFFNAVTTNKTDFYREKGHFDYLSGELLPYWYTEGKREISCWSCACSSGEEPYTLAIVLSEFARTHNGFRYRIAASDISTRVLGEAKDAVYDDQDISVIPQDQQHRYFLKGKDKQKDLYRVKKELRDSIDFFQFNLMNENYSDIKGSFSFIFCRNVLIYFDRKRQEEIIRKLIEKLEPQGFLFLGHSESMAGMGLNLKSVTTAIYRKDSLFNTRSAS